MELSIFFNNVIIILDSAPNIEVIVLDPGEEYIF